MTSHAPEPISAVGRGGRDNQFWNTQKEKKDETVRRQDAASEGARESVRRDRGGCHGPARKPAKILGRQQRYRQKTGDRRDDEGVQSGGLESPDCARQRDSARSGMGAARG